MAKKKSNIFSLVGKICAIILCFLTVVSFFLPTYAAVQGENKKYVGRVSNCQICFVSQETAQEEARDAGRDANEDLLEGDKEGFKENTEESLAYSTLAKILDPEFVGHNTAQTAAWLHFVAMITSIIAIALIIASFFLKKLTLAYRLSIILSAILMLVSIILSIVFLNVEFSLLGEVITVKAYLNTSLRFGGVVLGLITSILPIPLFFINVKKQSLL